MPFRIVLACDPYSNGRVLFRSMTTCTHIFDGASALLDHVRSSGINSKITGYLIHSHRYSGSDTTSRFWDLQSQIVAQLCIIRALSVVVAFVQLRPPPQVPSRPLARFLWAPFNRPEMAVSYGKDDPSFNVHAVNDNGVPPLCASSPTDSQRVSVGPRVKLSYNLHRNRDNPAVVRRLSTSTAFAHNLIQTRM